MVANMRANMSSPEGSRRKFGGVFQGSGSGACHISPASRQALLSTWVDAGLQQLLVQDRAGISQIDRSYCGTRKHDRKGWCLPVRNLNSLGAQVLGESS